MIEKKVVVGPFQCNCRILVCPQTGEAAVIDPGDEPKKILGALSQIQWRDASGVLRAPKVRYLLHTHAHLDHIGGTRGLNEGLTEPARIALHQDDLFIYEKLREQGTLFGLNYDDPLPVNHFLVDGETFQVGELRLEVIHTPGHSPGSIGIRLHQDRALGVAETVFSGDTLFQGSVGRTDLWGADGDLMFRSIRKRLLTLDGETRVCPGHGPDSKIGIEKVSNPFLV